MRTPHRPLATQVFTTRAKILIKINIKLREIIENKNPGDHKEVVEIYRAIKKKAREDIRKRNFIVDIREHIAWAKTG